MGKLTVLIGVLASAGYAQTPADKTLGREVTRMANVEPRVVKPGMVLTITGSELGRNRVEEVYLTDHRFDMQVKVLEQTTQTLKVRVPPFAKPGRQQILVLTSGEKAAYLEMPLYVLIEANDEEASATSPANEVRR